MAVNDYNIYRGTPTADDIDYETPVAFIAAGNAEADLVALGHTVGTAYWYSIAPVSAAGVEGTPSEPIRVLLDSEGALSDQIPNAILSASATPLAGGLARLAIAYNAAGQLGQAIGVQVCQVVGGTPDWAHLVATYGVSPYGISRILATPATVFADGSLVLAARAITAGGVTGAVSTLAAITIDNTPPDPVDYITVTEAE